MLLPDLKELIKINMKMLKYNVCPRKDYYSLQKLRMLYMNLGSLLKWQAVGSYRFLRLEINVKNRANIKQPDMFIIKSTYWEGRFLED
jgi:hypothetical protein